MGVLAVFKWMHLLVSEGIKETVMHWPGARWKVGGWRQELGNHYHPGV